MKFIVDENIRGNAVALLSDAGHDVLSIAETAPGMVDDNVLQLAVRESRILITLDKRDFGALIYQERLIPPPGVILFRIPNISVADAPHFILGSIAARNDWAGYFWVIDERGVRRWLFPTQ